MGGQCTATAAAKAVGRSSCGGGDRREPAWILGFKPKRTNLHEKYDYPYARGVWGGACETVFACDLIIATPDSSFAVTPAKLGVPYNISGMLTFLNAASPRIGREMAFTAKPLSAARAEQLGMINYVVAAASD